MSPQSDLKPRSIARGHRTSSVRCVQRNISAGGHQQSRGQANRGPRAEVAKGDQVDRDFAVFMDLCDREVADIVRIKSVEGDGAGQLGEGDYGCGAISGLGSRGQRSVSRGL